MNAERFMPLSIQIDWNLKKKKSEAFTFKYEKAFNDLSSHGNGTVKEEIPITIFIGCQWGGKADAFLLTVVIITWYVTLVEWHFFVLAPV